jgi:hypothetical protein
VTLVRFERLPLVGEISANLINATEITGETKIKTEIDSHRLVNTAVAYFIIKISLAKHNVTNNLALVGNYKPYVCNKIRSQ